ncbi:MAG: glucose-6-phosphate isomerase [Candidatus Binatia bacterium]
MAEVSQVSLDVNGFFEHMVGEYGLREADLDSVVQRVVEVLKELMSRRDRGELPFYGLPYDDAGMAEVERMAAKLRENFDTLVVLGIGGSALGARAAISAVSPPQSGGGPRVVILDNVDPCTVSEVLDGLNLKSTVFNVVSKSGRTAETMAQFLIIRDTLFRKVGVGHYRDHVVVTTDREKGLLRAIADQEGFPSLPVPGGVGGRFSVLSAVGLLPIAVSGIDLHELCEGARTADLRASVLDPTKNPAAMHAALLYLALKKRDAAIHVIMPYSDGLVNFAEWYAQLWAESLGKRVALDGTVVETGQTPVTARGATDQHSQVQLYVEGPRDKVVTFLRVEEHRDDITIPSGFEDMEGISYLAGHTLGELLNMEQRATELALTKAGRLNSTLSMRRLDAATIGELFHMFEVQTLVMGSLLAINPLDQPGVEAAKSMTSALAGRAGYENEAAEVRAALARKKDALVLA